MHFKRQILFNVKNYSNSEALYKVKDLENGRGMIIVKDKLILSSEWQSLVNAIMLLKHFSFYTPNSFYVSISEVSNN